MNTNSTEEPIRLPNFSEQEIDVLKKYFTFSERYRERLSDEFRERLKDHPLWGPLMSQMTPEQMKAQNERSNSLQRAAIYDGKWKEYADDLVMQGRLYARMNIAYNEWYEIITMAKVLLMPYIKKDYANSVDDATDIMDGLSKLTDYAMYGIAEAYFREKNDIIRAGEERFRLIFENSKDHILHIAPDGKILAINHSEVYSVEEMMGRNILDFQGDENKATVKEALHNAIDKREPSVFETEVQAADGKKYYSSTISPVIKNGEVDSAVVVARNVTREKEAEIALNELNQELESKIADRTEELKNINKELESFTYSVSHDLRSPLRAISGFSVILKEDFSDKLTGDAREALNEIISNVKRMGQLIDDLLEFSRLGKQNISKAEVNMKELFTTVIEDVKHAADVKAEFKTGPLMNVMGDRNMLKQVAYNLVSNAVKYSSKKEKPKVEIGSRTDNGNVVYYVKDNGVGFSMKYYDKLFGVFQRLHGFDEFEGTGVGLAIVQRIINRHDGRVWAEAKENEGATFYFSLPNQHAN